MSDKKNNIKKLQTVVLDNSYNLWLASLGVYATVEDESGKLYEKVVETSKDLVEKGKKVEKENKKKDKAATATASVSRIDNARKFVEDKVKDIGTVITKPFGLTSRSEVKELTEKVDKLAEIVIVLAQKVDNVSKPARIKAVAA